MSEYIYEQHVSEIFKIYEDYCIIITDTATCKQHYNVELVKVVFSLRLVKMQLIMYLK